MHEMRDLAHVAGESARYDEVALAQGVLILEFEWPLDDRVVALRATYPDSFPRMRPIVQLLGDPPNFPPRHCSPTDGTLCLLGRDTGQWPNQWSLATLLHNQLAHALRGTGDEDEQGEPAEYWWNDFGLAESYCLVDSEWTLGEARFGMLDVRLKFRPRAGGSGSIAAAVTRVHAANGEVICAWQGALPPVLTGEDHQTAPIPWVYVDQVVLPGHDGRVDLERLMGRLASQPRPIALSANSFALMFAIAYPSNLAHGLTGLGWLFAMFRWSGAKKVKDAKQPAILPTYRAGEQDMGARVPAVRLLRDRRIAVIGLGAIGAPVALELARAGCRELHLLDHDSVEPGNSIRWPLGATAWGAKKAASLSAFIEREYPWTKVHARSHAVGSFDDPKSLQGDEAVLGAALAQVNLVVDASTSQGVLNIMSDYCRQRGLPLISLYASPPVHGGAVARFSPHSPCPTCLEFAHGSGAIPRAPGFGDLTGLQQPPGCAERTFTGASYDLQELSLQAMRLAVNTLQDPEGSRTSIVQTLRLADDQGHRTLPTWREDVIPKAPLCPCSAPL